MTPGHVWSWWPFGARRRAGEGEDSPGDVRGRALGDSFLVEKQLMGKRAGAATEDNNHRVVRVGRDLCRLSSPSPMLLDSQDAGPFACFGPKEGCWVCSAAVSAPPRLEA